MAARKITPRVKVYMVKDKLYLNGQQFTVNNLDLLPDHLKPEFLSEKSSDNVQLFWSRDSYLSNFHIAPFKLGNVQYNCQEQYFCYHKALLFKDLQTAEKELQEKSPAQQKRLGKQVKNFDKNVWSKSMQNIMENGLTAKFDQNPILKQKLIATRGKVIGEASPYDNVWGIGFGLHSAEALDHTKWKGSNLLGKALMKIRDNY